MGEYSLKNHMFSIEMGGCDIVLGVEWLRTLGPITMDFLGIIHEFSEGWKFLHAQRSQSRLSRNHHLPPYGKSSKKGSF
jgi:hypothetical protein